MSAGDKWIKDRQHDLYASGRRVQEVCGLKGRILFRHIGTSFDFKALLIILKIKKYRDCFVVHHVSKTFTYK